MFHTRNARGFAAATLYLATVALLGWAGGAHAATYYVDREQGNDRLTGLAESVERETGAGPWRTLTKVSAHALQPGDRVLLRCGQSWRETLTLMRGGSSGNPITIGSNPSACTNKPAIDGGLTVPANEWQRHQGNIYKVQLPLSEIPGDPLSQSASAWRVISDARNTFLAFQSTCSVASAAGCVAAYSADNGTLSSNSFELRDGMSYTVRAQLLAPRGSRYDVVLRADVAGLPARRTASTNPSRRRQATGNWEEVSYTYTPNGTQGAVRLQIDLPNGATTLVRAARVEQALGDGFTVLDANAPVEMRRAHHPNTGYDATKPTSPYLKAGVSNYVYNPEGQVGSTYVVNTGDLVPPPGGQLTPGLDVWIRGQSWSVKQHKLTSVSGNRLYISPNSAYPLLYAGWGYFLTGALWMLDSPGEWFYDSTTRTLYAWMADSAAPGGRVTLSTLAKGVTIGSPDQGIFPSDIRLSNLVIANTGIGASFGAMPRISLNKVDIRNTAGFGVSADGAHFMQIDASTITNTGSDAVFGPSSKDAVITNNTIFNSGVRASASGVPTSLPRENFGALLLNARSTITGNTLTNVGYIGIHVGSNALVADNTVENFGLVLNDGGGLYAASASGATIRNNIVLNGVGNRDGLPSVLTTLMMSIYLDDYADGYTIEGNTLASADYGLTLHDASRNRVEGNIFYGARRSPLRLHESRANVPTGDISGNVIQGNQFVHTTTGPAILQQSSVTSIEDFGSFDYNAYSTLRSPVISQESGPYGYSGSFSLSDWQSKGLATGRTLEPHGYIAAPLRRYARGLLDSNLVSASQISQWGAAGGGNPGPTATVGSTCGPTGGSCVVFDAGGSQTAMTSPRFALVAGKTYRISFDGWVSNAAQVLSATVLRAGTPYESLMGLEPFVFSASPAWKRYSFTFVATADAASARMDLNDIAAGRQVRIANFEVVPYRSSGFDSAASLLVNLRQTTASVDCPVLATQPAACGSYFAFLTGQRVSWPVSLNPHSSLVVFSQDDSLPDSDGDGVGDSQDLCPASPSGAAVNASGCALGQ